MRAAVARENGFLMRTAQRFGVKAADVPDVVQKTWLVFATKVESVLPTAERAFLVTTLSHHASHMRRTYRRRPEEPFDHVESLDPADIPSVEELADRGRARALLEAILDVMDDDARQVFALFELEGLDSSEVAATLSIPVGTVKSRLRRARELYERRVAAVRAAEARALMVRVREAAP